MSYHNPSIPKDLQHKTSRLAIVERHIQNGVHVVNPEETYIEKDVLIRPGATLWPCVYLLGNTVIENGVVIYPEVTIRSSRIGKDTIIESFSYILGSHICEDCFMGPYAHIKESRVEQGAEIGKTEVVRSHIGERTVAKHESYIGDAEIGKRCNIGADTDIRSTPSAGRRVVICNFDGSQKHKTIIGDDVFVGSGTKIVAPRHIGRLAYIAAGSIITQDIPDGDEYGILVVTRRGTQEHKLGRVRKEGTYWLLEPSPKS